MGCNKEPIPIEDPCIICGCESNVGAHEYDREINDIASTYYCTKHYNEMRHEPIVKAAKKAKRTRAAKIKVEAEKKKVEPKKVVYAKLIK